MSYYGDVISLKHTIHRLLNSSQISIHPPSREILEFAFEEVRLLLEFIQKFESRGGRSGKRVDALRAEIREAVCKLEDELESSQFLSQTVNQIGADEGSSLDLEKVKQEINSFTEMVKKIEEYTKEDLELPEEDDAVSPEIGFDGKSSKVIGLSDQFSKIKDMLAAWWSHKLQIVSLVGMAGIGKTALATKIFEDEVISSHFELRAFVTLGPKYKFKEIVLDVLSQMNYDIGKIHMKGDEILADCLYQRLIRRRYLIVMDNIWSTHALDEFKSLLPPYGYGSRILLTTRLEGVAEYASMYGVGVHKIRFLNEEESWNLLREKVFGEGYQCLRELEKYGKKIAENCDEGLPLKIITVADLLSKKEKTREFWKETAEKKNRVFIDADDKISHVLFPSYQYLPQHLKPCFLYMGVFPPSCQIPASKLFNLWIAEGFLEPYTPQYVENFAKQCLEELVSRSVVLVRQQSSSCGTKICSLHSVFWRLCFRQAGREKFFHLINDYDKVTEGIESQRRMSIHNNILLGFTKVHDAIKKISTACSVLCTGPHHQYPVPMCYTWRLLRVLNALSIRFYKFPDKVLKSVHLRYLALTSNGKLPASISELRKLEYLIVRRHLNIKSSGAEPYMPVEIWDMKQLKHLQFMGSNLPDRCGAKLPNLLTLSDMSPGSCTKEIFERIPNLKKLGIQIELLPYAREQLSYFNHLSCLHKLESFKCVIVNPRPRSQLIAPIKTFPSSLKKLSLSGFGYPWEYMRTIAQLPNLEVLKLCFYAFQGPELETFDGEFLQLKFLLIEDTDLVLWRSDDECFPLLQRLILRHCYKLREIPFYIGDITTLAKMEVVDCPLSVASVKEIQDDQADKGNNLLEISVRSSLEDDKHKS